MNFECADIINTTLSHNAVRDARKEKKKVLQKKKTLSQD